MNFLIVAAFSVLSSTPTIAAQLAVDDALLEDVQTSLDASQASLGVPLAFPMLSSGTPAASAGGGGFGIGLQVGSPTALTFKLAGPHQTGVALGIGAGFGYGRGFGASLWLHADYLFHLATLLDADGFALGAYAGPGIFATIFGNNYGFGYAGQPYLNNFDYVGFGLRLPLGLSLAFESLPLEVFLELDPALSVFPGLGFGIGASLGFRLYF